MAHDPTSPRTAFATNMPGSGIPPDPLIHGAQLIEIRGKKDIEPAACYHIGRGGDGNAFLSGLDDRRVDPLDTGRKRVKVG